MMVLSGSKIDFANQISDMESRQGRCRDPEELNAKTMVLWSSVIGEPLNLRSPDWVWKVSSGLFNFVQSWTYKVLTVLFGAPLALFLAIGFAMLGFTQIWLLNPFNKFVQVSLTSLRSILENVSNTLLGPFFETVGLCLSKVKVRHQRIVTAKEETVFPFII